MFESFIKIWTEILQSNLFNFVLMLFVLGWIFKKFDIAGKLEQGRKNTEDKIILSGLTKEKAVKNLYKTQAENESVNNMVFDILDKSEKNADTAGKKLMDDALKITEGLSFTLKKTKENNIKALKQELTQKTAQAALVLAKEHIVNELKKDRNLHIKFINESIEALNGVLNE